MKTRENTKFPPLFSRVDWVLIHLSVKRCDHIVQRAIITQTSPLGVDTHLLQGLETCDGSKTPQSISTKHCDRLPPCLPVHLLLILPSVLTSQCSSVPPCNKHWSQFLWTTVYPQRFIYKVLRDEAHLGVTYRRWVQLHSQGLRRRSSSSSPLCRWRRRRCPSRTPAGTNINLIGPTASSDWWPLTLHGPAPAGYSRVLPKN